MTDIRENSAILSGNMRSIALSGFMLSARPILWPAIVLSSFAFGYLLRYEVYLTTILAVNLCLIASVGFLLNDIMDTKIDEANKIQRWSIKTNLDVCLFASAVLLCLGSIIFGWYWFSAIVVDGLIATIILAIAYSVFCKRIFLVGNVVAAGLSVTPGLIMFIDVYLSSADRNALLGPSAAFLSIGFLMLLSREIRFDEFDRVGDSVGNRVTIPMVFGSTVLRAVHLTLGVTSLVILIVLLTFQGKYSWPLNLSIGAVTLVCTAGLLIVGYRSRSRTVFSRITRLVMAVIPISMFASF